MEVERQALILSVVQQITTEVDDWLQVDGGLRGCELLTVAVGPLHVMLHVALLREADAAHFALEGLLASVLDHVDLQCALLVEGFVALSAFEGTFPCKNKQTTQS